MKQHTTPRKTCPFRRDSTPGELGGSPTETFVGQAYGAFWIPRHELLDYSDPNWREQHHVPQCAGTAIYRENCHPAIRPDVILKLPSDTTMVFATPAEFVAHHERIPLMAVDELIKIITPDMLWQAECARGGAKVIDTNALPKQNITTNEN